MCINVLTNTSYAIKRTRPLLLVKFVKQTTWQVCLPFRQSAGSPLCSRDLLASRTIDLARPAVPADHIELVRFSSKVCTAQRSMLLPHTRSKRAKSYAVRRYSSYSRPTSGSSANFSLLLIDRPSVETLFCQQTSAILRPQFPFRY